MEVWEVKHLLTNDAQLKNELLITGDTGVDIRLVNVNGDINDMVFLKLGLKHFLT